MIRTSDTEATRTGQVIRRVLVATDGGTASSGAEQAGIELAARSGASLIVFSVIDPARLQLPGGLFLSRVDQVRAERERVLARTIENARKLGVAAQFLIWEGDPGDGVIEAAEAEGADAIVVGSRARGPVGRLLLGSVSAYVVANSRGPVLVIRPGQQLADVWPEVTPNGVDKPIAGRSAAPRPA
jgi:nucleotide-binding universal stress UspA family protein